MGVAHIGIQFDDHARRKAKPNLQPDADFGRADSDVGKEAEEGMIMATKVESVPSRHTVYPWDQWLDGGIWQLSEVEIKGGIRLFRTAIYTAAKRRGLKVTVNVRGDNIYIQSIR